MPPPQLVLAAALLLVSALPLAAACTSLLVASGASADGSLLLARSDDGSDAIRYTAAQSEWVVCPVAAQTLGSACFQLAPPAALSSQRSPNSPVLPALLVGLLLTVLSLTYFRCSDTNNLVFHPARSAPATWRSNMNSMQASHLPKCRLCRGQGTRYEPQEVISAAPPYCCVTVSKN